MRISSIVMVHAWMARLDIVLLVDLGIEGAATWS